MFYDFQNFTPSFGPFEIFLIFKMSHPLFYNSQNFSLSAGHSKGPFEVILISKCHIHYFIILKISLPPLGHSKFSWFSKCHIHYSNSKFFSFCRLCVLVISKRDISSRAGREMCRRSWEVVRVCFQPYYER